MTVAASAPEFSRPLPIDTIGSDGRTQRHIEADEGECAALAQRLGLQGLSGFVADLTVDRLAGGEILAAGRVVADAVQTCVVTLEPVPAHVDEAFEVRFTTRDEIEPRERDIGPDDEEPPELLAGDALDLGELAAQQLALALDPWPRLPDAELPAEARPDPARDGPFAALAALRAGLSDENG
jgi:uncharacterized metal-binding protein YceD (DUF177 family)